MDLDQEQRKIEEEAALVGIRRHFQAIDKAKASGREADTPLGGALVSRLIGPMAELLREDLKKRSEGRATKGGACMAALRPIDPHLLCVVAARAALGQMSKVVKAAAAARRIGEALEDECVWHRWKQLAPRQAEGRAKACQSIRQREAAASSGYSRVCVSSGKERRAAQAVDRPTS